MQTKQIVQSSANVIRITNLSVGDLYKRFDDSTYSKSTYFGIVKGIYNDGEKTYVESVEYEASYGDIEAQNYVIRGDDDVSIFPATVEELEMDFNNIESKLEKKIEEKRDEIVKLEKTLETTRKLISGELQKELRTPFFKELTQEQFLEKKREKEALLID